MISALVRHGSFEGLHTRCIYVLTNVGTFQSALHGLIRERSVVHRQSCLQQAT